MQEQQETKNEKSEEKAKRLAVAMTVAGTLLVLFLVIFLIVQFVQIGVKNAQLKELEKREQELRDVNSDDQKDLEYYRTEEGLYYLALQKGWTKGGK